MLIVNKEFQPSPWRHKTLYNLDRFSVIILSFKTRAWDYTCYNNILQIHSYLILVQQKIFLKIEKKQHSVIRVLSTDSIYLVFTCKVKHDRNDV